MNESECRARAFPHLDPAVATAAGHEWAVVTARLRDEPVAPAFAHNDLGLVHILTDGQSLTGIIDWSDAEFTDPTIDFVGLFAAGGLPLARAVLEGYGTPPGRRFEQRIAFLWWLSPFHDILYGLDTGDGEALASGVEGVTTRLHRARQGR